MNYTKMEATAIFLFGNLRHTILTHVLFILQFTSWVDAVIFVFSLENEASFNAIYNYYVKMSQFRNMQEIPLILVGTQGKFNIWTIHYYVINEEVRKISIYIVPNIFWNVSKSKSSHFQYAIPKQISAHVQSWNLNKP